MHNLQFTLIITLFLLVVGNACQQLPTNPYKDMDAFFTQPRFKGNYFNTFNLLEADTVVQHIRTEVPAKWQGWACQAAYYNSDGVKGVTDSIMFRYLDVIGKAFPADSTVAFTELMRGELLLKLARYDTARVCFQKAYDLCNRINNPLLAASAVNGFAQLAICQNDYPEATKLYLRNYDYFSNLDTTMEKGRIFNALKKLGNVYTKSQNLQEAHKWYLKTWDFAMTGPSIRRTIYTVESATLLAQNYLLLNQLDSAQVMLDTAVYFQKINGNYYEEEIRLMLRGEIQRARGNCKAALSYCWAAKRMNMPKTDLVQSNLFNKKLAETYVCLGRLDSAIYFYQIALTTPDSVQQVTILEALSKVYLNKGDYSKALDYEKRSKALEKRIFTKEKEQTIGRLHAKNGLEKRERALAAQESKTQLNRVLMGSGLAILALMVIIGLFVLNHKQQQLQLAEQIQELLRQEQQLKDRILISTKQALVVKEAALTEVTEQLNLKNLLIQALEMKLTDKTQTANEGKETHLHDFKILTPEDWRKFCTLFEERYADFFPKLSGYHPKLSTSEIRLFMLIKLSFGSKEIADILGISTTSVYVSRSRLRQRLSLGKEEDLERFIQQF